MKRTIFASVFCLALAFSHGFAGVQLVRSFSEQNKNLMDFGISISDVGDVNNDGYDDVIVGAPGYLEDTGRAYIFLGGATMDGAEDVVLTGADPSDQFGMSVSGVGDLNNDGFDDVVVGAPGYSSNTGRAYVFRGGSPMNSTADLTMTGEGTDNYFGFSVSGAGNVNLDFYMDIIVGAYGFQEEKGRFYIYLGGLGMDNTPDVTFCGNSASRVAYSVSGCGDVNGDGYDDVIIGIPNVGGFRGQAGIFFGGASMDSIYDNGMNGEAPGDHFGYSVSGAGDVNGDGYNDMIVGAYGNASRTGRAYIYFGGASMEPWPDPDITMTGWTESYLGYSVSGAGDLNNDNFDDVIVGSPYYTLSDHGAALIFFGGSPMNATADLILESEEDQQHLGWSVSGAGDVNHDNYADVIVGMKNPTAIGSANVYLGGSSMDNASDAVLEAGDQIQDNFFGCTVAGGGDLNADGYDDIIVGASGFNYYTGRVFVYFGGTTTDNVFDLAMAGEAFNDDFGASVAMAGDLNGDGYDDAIIGAYGYASLTGRAYVFYGGSSMNNITDLTMTGAATGDRFGLSVAAAGDVDHDGYGDVIVGAYRANSAGSAYVYRGGASMDNVADVTMTGEAAGNNFGYSVSRAGDANADGYGDVVVGAFFYGSSRGRAYLYLGGSSMDNIADAAFTGSVLSNYGIYVSGGGDMNGDGYDDVVIGASKYGSNTGLADLYFGGSPVDNTADLTLNGETAGDYFGDPVEYAGDLNGDGCGDVLVGAKQYGSATGRVYVFLGGASMDNAADATLTGSATGDCFGCSVSGAGDVDGDGIPEFLAGASGNDSNIGKAYLYKAFVNARISVWFQGPYQAGGSMTTALKTAGAIPLTSPYADGRTVTAVPDGVTDWISLALRNSGAGPDICQRSFFVTGGGSIVDIDGSNSSLVMPAVADGDYYLLVRHRNHIAVMSASTVTLGTYGADLYTFASGLDKYYGGIAALLETGVYGMISGDANGTGTVDANDRSAAWNNRNKTGYESSDCNLSGTVDANDRSITWNNRNKTTSVP